MATVSQDQATRLAQALGANTTQLSGVSSAFTPPKTPASPAAVSSPVVTPRAAEEQVATIGQKASTAASDIAAQQARVSAQATADAQARAAQDEKARAQKIEQDRLAIDKETASAKSAAVRGFSGSENLVGTTPRFDRESEVLRDESFGDGQRKVTYRDGSYDIVKETYDEDGKVSYQPLSANERKVAVGQAERAKADSDYQAKAAEVSKAILDIQNGVVPLNPGQQAQVNGLAQQWNQLIENTKLANISASGTASIRGYQKGSAEYDPNFSTSVIGSIVTKGTQNVADLATQAASAVAKLTSAFQSDNIQAVRDAYDIYTKAQEAHSEAIEKTVSDAQEAIKAEQKRLDAAVEQREGLAADAAKNGAPSEVVNAILRSSSLSEAISSAGDYLQTGTGIVGEYALYKRDAQARGQTVMSFDEYQTRDANRKLAAAKAASAAGLPLSTVSQIDKLASSFDSSPITKQYNEVQNKKLSIDSIIDSGVKGPADLAIVYEFMKALDPTSVVRETEYATAAKSGNIFAGIAAKYNGYFKEGGGFLPESVKADFKTLIDRKFGVAEKQYENLRNETARKINIKTGMDDGVDYLTDYGKPSVGSDIIAEQEVARASVDSFIESNPDEAEAIAGLYEIEGTTDADILEYLRINGKITE